MLSAQIWLGELSEWHWLPEVIRLFPDGDLRLIQRNNIWQGKGMYISTSCQLEGVDERLYCLQEPQFILFQESRNVDGRWWQDPLLSKSNEYHGETSGEDCVGVETAIIIGKMEGSHRDKYTSEKVASCYLLIISPYFDYFVIIWSRWRDLSQISSNKHE